MADTVLVHPNRDKAEAKATKAIVILLLLVSAGLILVVTIGGWSELQGAQVIAFALAAVYVGMAFYVSLLTLLLVPVQRLLVAFAMRGFQQQWNVEVEVPRDDADAYGGRGRVQPA